MKKHLNAIVFLLLVLIVGFLAWNHSRHMAQLLNELTAGNAQQRSSAAAELISGQQFSDVVSGEKHGIRVQAAVALRDLGNADAVTHTLPLLKDEQKLVRDEALKTLEAIGAKSQANLTALIAGLTDGDINVRKGTMLVFTQVPGGIGPLSNPDVVSALVGAVKSTADSSPDAHGPVGDILSSSLFDPAANSRSVPLLVALLNNSDDAVKEGAADVLGKIGDPAAAPPLIALMHSPNVSPAVRRVVIGAIALIASPECQPSLIEALGNPEDASDARAQAAAGLGRLATAPAVTALSRALTDDNLSIRMAASGGLARAARAGEESPVNLAVTNQLLGYLSSGSPLVKLGVVEALEDVRASQADADLSKIVLAGNADPELKIHAIRALGFAGNTAGVQALVAVLNTSAGEDAKEAGISLAKIGAPAVPQLVSLLASGGVPAYYAAIALGTQAQDATTGATALQALKSAAAGTNTTVQRWSAVALGETGLSSVRPVLQQMIKSPDATVKFVAQQQLDKLPGASMG